MPLRAFGRSQIAALTLAAAGCGGGDTMESADCTAQSHTVFVSDSLSPTERDRVLRGLAR